MARQQFDFGVTLRGLAAVELDKADACRSRASPGRVESPRQLKANQLLTELQRKNWLDDAYVTKITRSPIHADFAGRWTFMHRGDNVEANGRDYNDGVSPYTYLTNDIEFTESGDDLLLNQFQSTWMRGEKDKDASEEDEISYPPGKLHLHTKDFYGRHNYNCEIQMSIQCLQTTNYGRLFACIRVAQKNSGTIVFSIKS